MSSALRSSILKGALSSTPNKLLKLYGTSRQSTASFIEAVLSLSKQDSLKLFQALNATVQNIIAEEEYVPESCYADEDPNRSGANLDMTITPDAESQASLNMLKLCAEVTLKFALANPTTFAAQAVDAIPKPHSNLVTAVLHIVTSLHTLLLDLLTIPINEATTTLNATLTLCEAFWLNDFEAKNDVITNVLPILTKRALEESSEACEVTIARLFTIRSALNTLDFEDSSINGLKKLLSKTISSPQFIGSSSGSKFLTYLFTVNDGLITVLHDAVKVQIPDAGKNQLRSYGEMYLRAWKISDDEGRTVLEETVLAPTMYASMHVLNAAMAKNLRVFLSPFHEAKKDPSVDEILYRLYSPVLWRSVNAANPIVRVNAAGILADTFPLHDPDQSQEEKVAIMKKGVGALGALMVDYDPKVRTAGSDAVSKVLQVLWDTLAIKDVRELLNTLVTKQSSDVSSYVVRAGAVTAVTAILENPASHGVMKAMLPLMSNLIHDDHPSVRLVVVKLLNKIKTMRGIKFYQIVKVPHIHARLAAEPTDSAVARELCALLLNSYFPQGADATASQQMSRTVDFLKKAPDAAKVFYGTLHNVVSVNTVSKLASMLLKCLSSAVETEKKQAEVDVANASKNKGAGKKGKKRGALGTIGEDKDTPESDDESETTPQATTINAADLPLMATISETIFLIWASIGTKLKKAEFSGCQKYLIAAFQGTVLTDAHAYFEGKAAKALAQNNSEHRFYSNRVCAALLQCAGNMPITAISGLVLALTDKLRMASEMSEGAITEATAKELTPHIALLCLWGKSDQVCFSLANSVEVFMTGEEDDGDATPKKGNKRRAQEVSTNAGTSLLPKLSPACALLILKTIMSASDASSIAARSNILTDDVARTVLEGALDSARGAAERFMSSGNAQTEARADIIVGACEVRGRMAIHQEALIAVEKVVGQGDVFMELSPSIKNMLTWISQSVVPVLALDNSGDGLLGLALSPIAKKSKTGAESPGDDVGASELGREMALSLVRSSLVMFGEWLAVGGGGAAEIAAFADKWGAVLKSNEAVRTSLFLAFSRLFLQLVRKGIEGRGFWQVLLAIDDVSTSEEAMLRMIFSTIVNLKTEGVKPLTVAVEEIYQACSNDGGQAATTMPKNLAELIPAKAGVPVVAQLGMMMVFANANALKELIKVVGEKVDKVETEDEEDEARKLTFAERCIGAIVCQAPLRGSGEAVDKMVRSLERGWGTFSDLVIGAKEARTTAA